MYCPKCAAQNSDEARFCRTCGMDIGFVSERLSDEGKSAKEVSDPKAKPTTFDEMFSGMFNMQPIKPMPLWGKNRGGVTENRPKIEEETIACNRAARRDSSTQAPRLDRAIISMFMGVAFLIVAPSVLLFVPDGRQWWFWMFIPAFACLGSGIAEFVRYRLAQPSHSARAVSAAFAHEPRHGEATRSGETARAVDLPPHVTSEMFTPPSVTEATTRHLGVEDRVHTPPTLRQKKQGER